MGRIISVFIIAALAIGIFYAVFERFDLAIYSPIPIYDENKKSIVNVWFPKRVRGVKATNLYLSAKAAILVDYVSADVLFAQEEKLKLPVASTAKIMTALVALTHGKLSDTISVSEKAAKVGENSMGLALGERLTLEEALYGLMLVSGNDAAVAIAEGVAGSEEAFVKLMNEKVQELGLTQTKFVNASGLEEDGQNQYSTAYDLAVIARYVWKNYPEFGQITATAHKFIEANEAHRAFDLYNDTNLLTTYPGVRGIKPGFTPEAGLCLVTYAENDGKKLLAVVLGSDDRRGEMKELLDFGFSQYGVRVSHPDLDL